MKFSDAAAGLVTMTFGAAVVLHTRTFPPMPGQPVGPALFPALLGVALVAAGAALIAAGIRRPGVPFVEVDAWVRRPRLARNFAVVVADLLFYAIAVERLGFLITAVLFLTVLFLAFGVRRARILPLAVGVTLAIHYGFYTLLRVPLPWGVLEGLAW